MGKKGAEAAPTQHHESDDSNPYSVKSLSEKPSFAIVEENIEALWHAFEFALQMKKLEAQVVPHAFNSALSECYTLSMHLVQNYDQRADDEHLGMEGDTDEPRNLGYDVQMPGWAGKLSKTYDCRMQLNGSPSVKSTTLKVPVGINSSALNSPRGSILGDNSDTQSTKQRVPIKPKKTPTAKQDPKPFNPQQVELLDHETDVVDKFTERDATERLRKDFFRRKAREAAEREAQEKEDASPSSKVGGSKRESVLANFTYDFKGNVIPIRAAHLAQLNTNQNLIKYDLVPQAPKSIGKRISLKSLSDKKRGSIGGESVISDKTAMQELKQIQEQLIQKFQKPPVTNNLELIKPRFGVKLQDKSPNSRRTEPTIGGNYDTNPEIMGRKMSKLSYALSHKSAGFTPGYLEKVETQRESINRQRLMLDTSSIAMDLDAVQLESTLNQHSALASKESLDNNKKSVRYHHRHQRSQLDSIQQTGSYLSKIALYDDEDTSKLLFLSPQNAAQNASAQSVLLPSITSRKLHFDQSSLDIELKNAFKTQKKRRVANPHEDEVISGGLSRILMYQRGAQAVGFNTTVGNNKHLEVIKESEQHTNVASRRSLSMLGGDQISNKMAHKPHYLKPNDSVAEILTQRDRFNQVIVASKKRTVVASSVRHSLNRSALL
ncbi:hypothetical protein FGO68_gene11118 [Halteria grandinella]|uniref:Uncharacterized protein n=1 Tax=Halteria grandinella TaxID=5974 RepID=A0A8J8NVU8_HALGN|nr:hypothetical protein FGO68_gene11118 [Halteria grandinella]